MRNQIIILFILIWRLSSFSNEIHINKKNYQIPETIPVLYPKIIRSIPHKGDPKFTQGLLVHDGVLWMSTGGFGNSSLKKIDLNTGELTQIKMIKDYFAEGISFFNGQIYNLSWMSQKVHLYDMESFNRIATPFFYYGEGWGLTEDGTSLIMSNGSDKIYFRDPENFKIINTISVTLDNQPIAYLNELEYVNKSIFANVFLTHYILKIDSQTGQVAAIIDAKEILCSQLSDKNRESVLNGIAYDSSKKTFYITGKNCPKIFEVTFEKK